MRIIKNGDKVRFRRGIDIDDHKYGDTVISFDEVGIVKEVYSDMVETCRVKFPSHEKLVLCKKVHLILA